VSTLFAGIASSSRIFSSIYAGSFASSQSRIGCAVQIYCGTRMRPTREQVHHWQPLLAGRWQVTPSEELPAIQPSLGLQQMNVQDLFASVMMFNCGAHSYNVGQRASPRQCSRPAGDGRPGRETSPWAAQLARLGRSGGLAVSHRSLDAPRSARPRSHREGQAVEVYHR
jgi:hypothetical protein